MGGSQAYRTFIRTELMPEVARRYRTTSESAIVGESLAGLFVVETLALEPDLFDTYIAIDRSLWWNDGMLQKRLIADPPRSVGRKRLFIGVSRDGAPGLDHATLEAAFGGIGNLELHYREWPAETHATVYHPAAL